MEFQNGVFQRYRVASQSGLHIGAYSYHLPFNAIVEFDGVTVKYSGQSFTSPATGGAVRVGWLVPEGDPVTEVRPQPAGLTIHPSNTAHAGRGTPMMVTSVAEDEQVVGTLQGASDKREEARKASLASPGHAMPPAPTQAPVPAPPPAERPSGRLPPPQSVEPAPSAATRTKVATSGALVVEAEEDELFTSQLVNLEGQEGRTVGKVLSPTKNSIKFEDTASVDAAIRKLETSGPTRILKATPKPKPSDVPAVRAGDTLEELFPDLASSGVPKSVGASQDSADTSGAETLAALMPEAAASEVPKETAVSPATVDFTWEKTGPVRDRVKRAFDLYGKDRNALEQICLVEAKQAVTLIRSEMAKRFR